MPWIYIGGTQGAKVAKQVLDESKRIFIAQDIERVCDQVRDNFVDYIGQVSLKQPDKVLWYSSPVASKSVSQTTIFQQYVYQKMIGDFIKKNESGGDLLVVTDSDEFISCSSRIWGNQIKVFGSNWKFYGPLYLTVKARIRLAKYFILWGLIRFLKNKHLGDCDIVLHSWIDERMFKKASVFSDPYFGNLEEVFLENNHRVARMAPLRLRAKDVFYLRRYSPHVIFPAAYLRFSDFIKVFFRKFSVVIPDNNLTKIKDRKILDYLLKHEITKENYLRNFQIYMLWFCAYKNIGKTLKKGITFFYPFENQPWEKMLNLALSDFNRIGYQHVTIPRNWLDYRVSSFESQPLPKFILTSGKEWLLYLNNYYNSAILKNAGTLRFSYLFTKKKLVNLQGKESIVVALPVYSEAAICLQEQILRALKNGCFDSSRLIIKPHPHLPKESQLKNQLLAYNNCEFSNNNISSLIEKCKLLITTDSSVIFESVFSGLKTLYFIPEQFSMGLEFSLKDHIFIAYEYDFLIKIKDALDSMRYPDAVLEKFFSAPSYNTFLECLHPEVTEGAQRWQGGKCFSQ
ncbi:MAG: hypothetical protein PHC37_06725 [Candidatus Omnitrophica bacterium]|nr:hypothetical protein [Candidatus Omnitrophota bacterium]